MKNPFEHLRVELFEDTAPLLQYKKNTIVCNGQEQIDILTAEVAPGKVALGYIIFFENGRKANRLPSLEFGYFKSVKDATLYFLGYVMEYESYFSSDAIKAVKNKIFETRQQQLF